MVAGPGFGNKTALLVLAMADNARAAVGRDFWLSCEPSDESAAHLVAGLTQAMGLPGADLDRILEAEPWAADFRADLLRPRRHGHEIPAGSDGAAVVARLAVDLPANGHLVLEVSRDRVPVPTARLAVNGQLTWW